MNSSPDQDRIKRLDLLGGLGAGILGAGLALVFAERLQPFAVPALLLGILSHGWAMFQKGQLEKQAGTARPRWADIAEWSCWLMLACLVLYIAYRMLF